MKKLLILLLLGFNLHAYADGSHDHKSSSNSDDFKINPDLCQDEQGPDCSKLKLGDDYLTTSNPAIGYLFSCSEKNPSAPGAIESKITWIDFENNTWNFFEKLWLPSGEFNPKDGVYIESSNGNKMVVEINNLPVDGKIGDWPMSEYKILTSIDRNRGIPKEQKRSFIFIKSPEKANYPSCLSLGAIGVTKNGVLIFNATDGRGEDAVAREIVDEYGGHPARDAYHYHFIHERLDNKFLDNGHSGIVGYINDGFPLYGYKGVGGIEMTNEDLDLCHGHEHDDLGYHYHSTIEYPYTVGCYKGEIINNIQGSGNSIKPPTKQKKFGNNQKPPPKKNSDFII